MRQVDFLATMDRCQSVLWVMKYILDLRGKVRTWKSWSQDQGKT